MDRLYFQVTVFDISGDNKRYAMELADVDGVQIDYQVGDVLKIDMAKFGGKMICSDFHPFTKVMDTLDLQQPTMSCFSTEIYD